MIKKLIAITALAALAVFAIPAAASAVTYVSGGDVTVTVSGTPTPGKTVKVTAERGSFPADSTAAITLSGSKTTVGVAKAPTKTVNASGSVTFVVKLPATASGVQTATITGAQTGRSGSATITVVPSDSTSAAARLASTGYTAPAGLICGGSAALVLGLALTIASVLKRRRASV